MPLTPTAMEHVAKYEIKANQLPGLLGIKMPPGAAAALEHVSDSSGRASTIGTDHVIIIRVSWTDEKAPEDQS